LIEDIATVQLQNHRRDIAKHGVAIYFLYYVLRKWIEWNMFVLSSDSGGVVFVNQYIDLLAKDNGVKVVNVVRMQLRSRS
jgi:hypothetical protein